MTEINYGAVFYTDGGARPNPGNAGWGIHGYIYDLAKEVKNPGKHNCPTTEGYIELYSGKGGTPVKIEKYFDGFGTLEGTNNLAEIIAFKKLLELIKQEGYKQVCVHLDSSYVLKTVSENWYERWKQNDWKTSSGQPVSNLELWHEVFDLYNEVKETTILNLSKIKGHIGLLGNTRADELATCGVFAKANHHDFEEMLFSPVQGYANPKVQFNSLFTRNRWYFVSGQNEPDKLGDHYLYLTGYHGTKPNKKASDDDDDEDIDLAPPDSINFGVSQSDTYYGLVCVKEPEPLIDKMQQTHNQLCTTDYQLLVVGHLGTILTSRHYNKLLKYGGLFLNKNPVRNQLDLPDGSMVTWEISPQRRSFTIHEIKDFLRDLLLQYQHGQLTTTDLTDHIYETIEKGKKTIKLEHKVRADFPNTARYLDIQANVTYKDKTAQYPLRLTLNIDLPVRNHLQRLTEEGSVKPTVTLVTWSEGPKAFRYGVVIERNDEQLLWVGTDCNLRLIRDENTVV